MKQKHARLTTLTLAALAGIAFCAPVHAVTVIHAGDTVESIMENCGKYAPVREGNKLVRRRSMGCAYVVTHRDMTICYIYAHPPTNTITRDIYRHEVDHCLGMTHPEARGKL